MENQKHITYQSLLRKPKIGGLSQGLFMMFVMSVTIVILILGVSLVGLIGSFVLGFFLHRFLTKAERKDDLFLLLWIGKIFKGDNHYKAEAPINHTGSNKTKSIPTLH